MDITNTVMTSNIEASDENASTKAPLKIWWGMQVMEQAWEDYMMIHRYPMWERGNL